MILYIEFVIIDNLVVDWLILDLILSTTKYRAGRLNKFIFCFLGVVFALILPFVINPYLIMFYRILSATILTFSIRKYKKVKTFLLYFALLMTYTFLLGGVIIALMNFLNIDYIAENKFLYSCNFPIFIYLVFVIIIKFFVKKLIKTIKNHLKNSNYYYDIKLSNNSKTIKAIGFLDSGNSIKIDGKIVNVVSVGLFLNLFKEVSVEDFVLGKLDLSKFKNAKYINISSVSNTVKCLSVEIDELQIRDKIINNPVIAVAMKNFENYDCILNNQILECVK